ncbi:MAG: amino acid dehydrogenase [Gammaproteobacteria bacterium]|nr:amino acid dehydrogenase [Gammaproteobacteria bacterium]
MPLQFDDLPQNLNQMGFGDIHIKYDPQTELLAIITIHNDKLGPTIGGCRCIEYPSFSAALQDALRLAKGMSYKTAISNLAWGGGKAVLLKPKQIKNREAYYRTFGRFVNELGGRYITSIDSGTELSDLAYIAKETPYVSGLSHYYGDNTDPSLATAMGVKHGIEAAVKFKFDKDSLAGLRVAIQGIGHVGYHLCELLYPLGVELIVTDVNQQALERCKTQFNAKIVAPEAIYQVACDIFSPCALGGVLNETTIPQLKASIVAGSANNQLAENQCGELLNRYNILYAPDFVISAGGVILATALYDKRSMTSAITQLQDLYEVLLTIFTRAEKQKLPTHIVAEHIAEERLSG